MLFRSINIVQPTITQIQTTWNSIPPQIKGIITLAIPSMFALFFAWSKNRAMQKLEQTKQEANQTITQLASENLEAKTEAKKYQDQFETLKGSLTEDKTADFLSQLTTKDKKIQHLETQLTEARSLANVVMHPTTKDIITRLESEGYVIRKAVT